MKINKLNSQLDEGWSINIYRGDRRLICSLNSSHPWSFLSGLILGLLLTATWLGNLPRTQSDSKTNGSVQDPVDAPTQQTQTPTPAPLLLE